MGRVEDDLMSAQMQRDPVWSQNLVVGYKDYVEYIKMALGINGCHRAVVEADDSYALKKLVVPYTAHSACERHILSVKNTILLR
jgi:hypothetical protein